MDEAYNKIIIWGVDNFNTLGLFRELGGRNFDVFFLILGKATGCASSCRFCKNYAVVNSVEDGHGYLLEHFCQEKLKPIIITPGDGVIEYIDQHRVLFEEHFLIPGTKSPGLLTWTDNKVNMAAMASEIGFLVPYWQSFRYDSSLEGIPYPCIIKPSHLTAGHYNEFKYRICKSEKELKNTLKYVRKQSEFILQQYISKEKDCLIYGCRMKTKEIRIAGALIRDRFADNGDSSHGLITKEIPSYINQDLIYALLDRIDYCGLFSMEFGLKNNQAWFFEVNLRNDGTSHYFYQAGANIPLAWVLNMMDKCTRQINTSVQRNGWFIDEIADIGNVLNGTIRLGQWKKERAEATIFKYYDHSDLKPWQNMKRRKWRTVFGNLIVKRYRLKIVYLVEIKNKFCHGLFNVS